VNTQELIQKTTGAELGPILEAEIAEAVAFARAIIERLAKVKTNAEFHQWREQVLIELRSKFNQLGSAYLAIAVAVAYEQYKAKGENWFKRMWGKIWGAVTRVGLQGFVETYGKPLLGDALTFLEEALRSQNNTDIKAARDAVFMKLRMRYASAKDNWIALLLDGAMAVLFSRGLKF
jgi:hypothetical protein